MQFAFASCNFSFFNNVGKTKTGSFVEQHQDAHLISRHIQIIPFGTKACSNVCHAHGALPGQPTPLVLLQIKIFETIRQNFQLHGQVARWDLFLGPKTIGEDFDGQLYFVVVVGDAARRWVL